jgi:ABC-type glutathione transport system ATPase component
MNATRERLRKVMDAVDDIKSAITALEENRLDDARRGISQLYKHEEEAERLRRSITDQLAKGDIPTSIREELTYVLKQVDTIADFFRSAARQISSILQIKLPTKAAAATVELIGIVKDYMLGKVPVKALCGVDLKVDKGDFLAILGPSGSGKSTLLNMIGLLDKPTEGTLKIEGINTATLSDSDRVDVRRRIGFVFQFFNLIPRLSARENVELPMAISNLNPKARRVRAEELLTNVGLGDRMNHKSSEL